MRVVFVAGILEVAELWSSGFAELGPAQPQLVDYYYYYYTCILLYLHTYIPSFLHYHINAFLHSCRVFVVFHHHRRFGVVREFRN